MSLTILKQRNGTTGVAVDVAEKEAPIIFYLPREACDPCGDPRPYLLAFSVALFATFRVASAAAAEHNEPSRMKPAAEEIQCRLKSSKAFHRHLILAGFDENDFDHDSRRFEQDCPLRQRRRSPALQNVPCSCCCGVRSTGHFKNGPHISSKTDHRPRWPFSENKMSSQPSSATG